MASPEVVAEARRIHAQCQLAASALQSGLPGEPILRARCRVADHYDEAQGRLEERNG